MIITIQSINKRFVVKSVYEVYSARSMSDATKFAGNMANAIKLYGEDRATIMILPVKKPTMATKTPPAKKAKALKKLDKKKKVVKAKKK